MEPTRRLWAVAGLAGGLVALAVVLARPLALVGAALVGTWLLSRQYLFSRELRRLHDDLTVEQSPARTLLRTDASTPVTLRATLAEPSALACSIRASLPVGATTERSPAVTLDSGETDAEETVDVRWPVAGRHQFGQATLSATDGLFEGTVPVGTAPTVTVEPRGPRNVHVGQGGDRLASAYGEHEGGSSGSGIEPAELREYTAGDTLEQIDWNATARLETLFVREFETETDRKTLVMVDHRATLGDGQPGETKLAYLREAALAVVDSAGRLDDPLGLLAVGDGGITTQLDPTVTAEQYATARRTLLDLEPTGEPAASDGQASTALESPIARASAAQSEVAARRAVNTLGRGGEDPFERTVRPFFADRQRYRTYIESNPLYRAVEGTLATEPGRLLAVLCTDDASPAELRETVKLLRGSGHRVLLLLAPTVLYEPGGLTDLEEAYDRYVTFEQLRRDLGGTDGVTAVEVAPGDRLAAVLAEGRQPRQHAGGGRG
jgi:uncharacterized protein (DUF58 family)